MGNPHFFSRFSLSIRTFPLLFTACFLGHYTGLEGWFKGEEVSRFLYPLLVDHPPSLAWWLLTQSPSVREIRPLATVLWWLNVEGAGTWFPAYFLLNLGLHTAWVTTAYRLIAGVSGRKDVALLAAAFLALHPSRFQILSRLPLRYEPLCGVFLTLGILRWIRGNRTQPDRIDWGVLGWFLAALFSKEMGLMAPFLGWWCLHRVRDREGGVTGWQLVKERSVGGLLALLGVLWTGYFAFRLTLFNGLGGYPLQAQWNFSVVKALFWHIGGGFGVWEIAEGIQYWGLLVAVFTGWFLWKIPATRLGWGWFFLSLVPAANIYAPWYVYLPSLGVCWCLAEGTVSLLRNPTAPWLFKGAGAAVVCGWMVSSLSGGLEILGKSCPDAVYLHTLYTELPKILPISDFSEPLDVWREEAIPPTKRSWHPTKETVRLAYRDSTLEVRSYLIVGKSKAAAIHRATGTISVRYYSGKDPQLELIEREGERPGTLAEERRQGILSVINPTR